MSKDSKFFARPRVRFSQITNVEENLEVLPGQTTATKRNLPKIKSVTSVKTPVKIVSFKNQSDNGITSNVSPTDDTTTKESETCCDSGYSLPEKTKSDHTSQDQLIHDMRTDNEESLTNLCNTENVKSSSIKQTSEVNEKFLNKGDTPEIVPTVTYPPLQIDKTSSNVLKPKNNVIKNSSSRSTKNKFDKGKENKDMKGISRLVGKPSCSKPAVNIKKKTNVGEVNIQKSNFRKHDTTNSNEECTSNIEKQARKTDGIRSKRPQKNLNTKSTTVNVMPCYKYTKVIAKNKSLVKKSIVRDIVVPSVKASVELGISKRHSDSDIHKTDKETKVEPRVTSSEKLSHPKYNSIACIANRLNEVKKEKIVTHIENLPTTYKKLINEKTSSALDFPLNEVIYKNLVDLSINEKQFPCKIMRSRDPQPRQKDLVPKLSDFFTPEPMDEYYTVMCAKPRSPDITEHWNAFRISDKISKWKNNVDNY